MLNLFPDVPVIDRPGIISAWDDPKFVAAIEKTGRKNLIIAGVTVDVCLAFAAMQAVDAGYYVYGVVDASGALDTTTRELAIARERVGGCDAAKAPKLDADEKAQAKKANAAARLWISGIEALQRNRWPPSAGLRPVRDTAVSCGNHQATTRANFPVGRLRLLADRRH